jgi:hypothetical protein
MASFFPFGSGSLFLSFLLWYALMFGCGIYVFSGGFLLRRNALEDVSAPFQADAPPAAFQKAVVLVVDALKYDFAVYNSSHSQDSNYKNRMPVFDRLVRDGSGLLFEVGTTAGHREAYRRSLWRELIRTTALQCWQVPMAIKNLRKLIKNTKYIIIISGRSLQIIFFRTVILFIRKTMCS